jgi:hypothetical protein
MTLGTHVTFASVLYLGGATLVGHPGSERPINKGAEAARPRRSRRRRQPAVLAADNW